MDQLPAPADLNYFLEVARSLNLSRAAERIGIAQPTLSLSMQRLEKATKAKLLIRGKTGVQLTRAGLRLAADAASLLNQWGAIVESARRDEQEVRGRIVLGCHSAVAMYTLEPIAAKLLARYPEVELKLEHDLSRRLHERVIRFEIDIGLIINPVAHPDLRMKSLLRDEVSLWESAENQNRDVLIYDPGMQQAQAILKKVRASFRRSIESSDLEVIATLAAAGAGVAILPGRVANRASRNQILRLWKRPREMASAKVPKIEDRLYLVSRAERSRSQTIDAISKALVEELSE